MKFKTISIGELLWDLLPDKRVLGGAPANLAFRLNELGQECYLVSKIGTDELGNDALNMLISMGLSSMYIQQDEKLPTGTVEVSFDHLKNPSYIITPGVAYDNITLNKELLSLAGECQCIAFGTLAQRTITTRQAIAYLIDAAPQAVKFLDVNLRKDCFTKNSIKQSFQIADILKANHHEIYLINEIFALKGMNIPEICRRLSAIFFIKTILVTLEHNGAYLYDIDEGEHYTPGYEIHLEDPLGAGDAFSAGFLDALFRGKKLKEATEYGNLLGAFVATKKGATHNLSQKEIEKIANECKRICDKSFLTQVESGPSHV